MKEERILHVLGKVDEKDIREADPEEKIRRKKPAWKRWTAMASCACIVAAVCFSLFSSRSGMAVSACACGTDEEITAAGVVMNTGTISDTGEMTGHPLMFYLTGKDIETVRFSCKNQQINFMDWTEKRDEYGSAQNFTVAYGGDASEYYYLTIDWVPDTLIRELTDDPDSKIATLPEEMRQDIIVMEITFESGKTATKAITISLLDDGIFYAAFDDYEISESDDFIKRPDSAAISRDALYSQKDSLIEDNSVKEEEQGDSIRMVMVNGELYLDTGHESAVTIRCGMLDGQITSTVSGTERPTENDQSNFGSGYGYQYGSREGMIEINMDDKWLVFATEKVLAGSQLMAEPAEDLPFESEEERK